MDKKGKPVSVEIEKDTNVEGVYYLKVNGVLLFYQFRLGAAELMAKQLERTLRDAIIIP